MTVRGRSRDVARSRSANVRIVRVLTWLFSLVRLPAALHAQAIGGRVLDRDTGKPLWGVRVSIAPQPGDTVRTSLQQDTPRDGTFTLVLPRAGRVALRFVVAVDQVLVSDSLDVGVDDFVQKEFRLAPPANPLYYEFQVEKPAVPEPGSQGPRYPVALRDAGVSGGVIAQFIVDTTGRMRPGSFTILRVTHEPFATAIRTAVEQMQFIPAQRDGRKVAQLLQQPFTFQVGR